MKKQKGILILLFNNLPCHPLRAVHHNAKRCITVSRKIPTGLFNQSDRKTGVT
jgi:hypothetical protein